MDAGNCLGAIFHGLDRKSTRLNSSHSSISYAVFCVKKKRRPAAPRTGRPRGGRRRGPPGSALPLLHRLDRHQKRSCSVGLALKDHRPVDFFFNDTATTEIYTLSLHDALPISQTREHVLLARQVDVPYIVVALNKV